MLKQVITLRTTTDANGITAAVTETACSTGTYQPNEGQSSCIDTSAVYYTETAKPHKKHVKQEHINSNR